jgi:hypothetical protein
MVINFMVHKINRSVHKLTRTLTLIKKNYYFSQIISIVYVFFFFSETKTIDWTSTMQCD